MNTATMTIQRTVTVIPPKVALPSGVMATANRRRVAAYARVSTKDEEQLTSYEAQMDYYTKHIQANPEWIFAGMYADKDRTGTTTKRRDAFNRMITDALDGKIDLILTKSVSRFARNTIDSLQTVRKLKEKGIEVYFEKENIYTLDSKGELLITIMSSLAQEESRSISENVTWGKRRQFEAGKVSLPYKQFLGYEKGSDGFPAIVEEEAQIIRLIYRLYFYGKSPSFIASLLTGEGIPTPGGKPKWRSNAVISILTNEKYKGDAILQKSFTVDFLTKRQKINEGEVQQYYVRNSHPAIIEPELFDLVQFEMKRRQKSAGRTSCDHPFSGKLYCGTCGGMYGPKVWHKNSVYRRTVWQCNDKHKTPTPCRTSHLLDKQIQAAFLSAFNDQLGSKAEIFAAYDEVLRALTDNTDLDAEAVVLAEECEVVAELTRKAVQENATAALDQGEYQRRYARLKKRYDTAGSRLAKLDTIRQERNAKRVNITQFLQALMKQGDDLVAEFDEQLWYITVDFVTVHADGRLVVTFRDGVEGAVEVARAGKGAGCTCRHQ